MFPMLLTVGIALVLVWYLANKVLVAYLAKRNDLPEARKKLYGRILIIVIFFPYVAYIENILKP